MNRRVYRASEGIVVRRFPCSAPDEEMPCAPAVAKEPQCPFTRIILKQDADKKDAVLSPTDRVELERHVTVKGVCPECWETEDRLLKDWKEKEIPRLKERIRVLQNEISWRQAELHSNTRALLELTTAHEFPQFSAPSFDPQYN